MKTKYETLMEQKDRAEQKAVELSDGSLKTFFANAAKGFDKKAKDLLIPEV